MRRRMTEPCIVLTTCDSDESALKIATALVDQKLAVCATMVPGTKSYYHFEGSAHLDAEILLMIKTSADLFDELSKRLTEIHPYQVPEILMIKTDASSAAYLEWMRGWMKMP